MEKGLGSIPSMRRRAPLSKPTTERKVSPGGCVGASPLCGSLIPTQQSSVTTCSLRSNSLTANHLQSKTVLSTPGLQVQVLNHTKKETDFSIGQVQIPYVKYQLNTQ